MRVRYRSSLRSNSLLQLFFDFYVMNEVWFRTQGAEHYGYAVTKILPYNKERVINETFENRVATLKKQVIAALEASVRTEIRHWRYHTKRDVGTKYSAGLPIPLSSHYARACLRHGLRMWPSERTLMKLPLCVIKDLYFTSCWKREYGGKKWGEATHLLIQLKQSKTLKEDIFLIDRIFDLQHNTGFILNKTVFGTLDRRESVLYRNRNNGRSYVVKPLNFRFRATLAEMIEYCTNEVRRIYTANLNYLGVAQNA